MNRLKACTLNLGCPNHGRHILSTDSLCCPTCGYWLEKETCARNNNGTNAYDEDIKNNSLHAILQSVIASKLQKDKYATHNNCNSLIDRTEYVDMGGSVLWASCNLGAKLPEETGDFYCWGEIKTKNEYTEDSYLYKTTKSSFFGLSKEYIYQSIGSNIAGTHYDVATHILGSDYMLPSIKHFKELKKICTWEFGELNGVKGCKFKNPHNGNELFFPATGYKYGYDIREYGISGHYPSADIATNGLGWHEELHFDFCNKGASVSETNGFFAIGGSYGLWCWGCNIRPVKKRRRRSFFSGNDNDRNTKVFNVNGVRFNMIRVGRGTFMMGAGDNYASDDEKPVHQVTLANDYYIGETQVTQELWKVVMNDNPSHFEGDSKPVESISWFDCQSFIERLNAKTGKHFRLPTEAEWEFAARGGDKNKGYKYSGSNNIDEVAWCHDNSGEGTYDVATKQPNELGIYDMSGNVWEWCQDWYDSYRNTSQTNPTGANRGYDRVFRGGSWDDFDMDCRSSNRNYDSPDYSCYNLGLRLVLSE